MAKIILHLKAADATPDLRGWHLRLYRVIREMCESEGIDCVIRPRDKDIKVGTRNLRDQRFNDGNLHIIDDRSLSAAGILNAGVAYFWEFWHLDPIGTKAFSSIGTTPYDPTSVTRKRAQTFAGNLRTRYLGPRKSKYNQPSDTTSFPSGAVSVFFQGRYPVNSGATALSDIDVLRAIQAGAGERTIIVKPHPLASDDGDIKKLHEIACHDPRIKVSDANVHDILSSSVATASINSTVALEGFMHGVPALLFGTSDFHHIATTITDLDDVHAALHSAQERDVDFDTYLAWYFLKNCIPLNSGKLHDKIWARFDAAGFPKGAFH